MKLSEELKNAPTIPGFRAVEESRKWKEAVARKTEGMTSEEVIAYFNRRSPNIPRTPSRTETTHQ